ILARNVRVGDGVNPGFEPNLLGAFARIRNPLSDARRLNRGLRLSSHVSLPRNTARKSHAGYNISQYARLCLWMTSASFRRQNVRLKATTPPSTWCRANGVISDLWKGRRLK